MIDVCHHFSPDVGESSPNTFLRSFGLTIKTANSKLNRPSIIMKSLFGESITSLAFIFLLFRLELSADMVSLSNWTFRWRPVILLIESFQEQLID